MIRIYLPSRISRIGLPFTIAASSATPTQPTTAETAAVRWPPKVLLRALAHHYVRRNERRNERNGPFFLQLSDFHASNIFVVDEWNVTCIIDLEWLCSLPVENLSVPYWITGRAIDGIKGGHLVEFEEALGGGEFMEVFAEEEDKIEAEHGLSLTKIMLEMSKSGGGSGSGIASLPRTPCILFVPTTSVLSP